MQSWSNCQSRLSTWRGYCNLVISGVSYVCHVIVIFAVINDDIANARSPQRWREMGLSTIPPPTIDALSRMSARLVTGSYLPGSKLCSHAKCTYTSRSLYAREAVYNHQLCLISSTDMALDELSQPRVSSLWNFSTRAPIQSLFVRPTASTSDRHSKSLAKMWSVEYYSLWMWYSWFTSTLSRLCMKFNKFTLFYQIVFRFF